ncbi:hypothetical protein [Deinococcus grandis]|uniref:hypothetical protein n=1 Tax=Deinococcus grandis TaxID=57498 RepID=UPI0038994038
MREGLATPAPPPPPTAPVTRERLLALPDPGPLPAAEVRDTLGLALDVFGAWFAGRGVITRNGRIEDTATAELARALLWQWVHVGAPLDDGSVFDRAAYRTLRRALRPDDTPEARLLDHVVLADAAPAYVPLEAHRLTLTERTFHD